MDTSNFTPYQKFIFDLAPKFLELDSASNPVEIMEIMSEIKDIHDSYIKASRLVLLSKITELINK